MWIPDCYFNGFRAPHAQLLEERARLATDAGGFQCFSQNAHWTGKKKHKQTNKKNKTRKMLDVSSLIVWFSWFVVLGGKAPAWGTPECGDWTNAIGLGHTKESPAVMSPSPTNPTFSPNLVPEKKNDWQNLFTVKQLGCLYLSNGCFPLETASFFSTWFLRAQQRDGDHLRC